MSRYLFISIPEKGHINPMLGTAQHLKQLGNQVFFASMADISKYLEDHDLLFLPHLLQKPDARPTKGAELVSLVQDKPRLKEWVQGLLCHNLDSSILVYQKCFEEILPDCVVLDPLLYAPALAAHTMELPWVALSNSMNPVLPANLPSDLLDASSEIDSYRNSLLDKHGLVTGFSGCDILSPHLTIAFTTPEVSGCTSNNIWQVGPALTLTKEKQEFNRLYKDRPLVYASFGSQVYYWPEFFVNVIEACSELRVELALAIGDLAQEERFQRASDWVHVFDYAPQKQILKDADLFITHGGANSFMEAIYYGVPMVINPICNDQFHQSYFIERNKLGIQKPVTKMSVPEIRTLIKDCLSSNDWYSGLEKAHISYQKDGSLKAARAIEALC